MVELETLANADCLATVRYPSMSGSGDPNHEQPRWVTRRTAKLLGEWITWALASSWSRTQTEMDGGKVKVGSRLPER